jgi:hypothetical protein
MDAISTLEEQYIRKETESLGVVEVPGDKLWAPRRNARLSTSASGMI